ncbi:MAG TPA: 3-hydroxybutyryl-CoA dehydrogenase [Longimicrobiales bacterium]|nr:3-hydroxybutyryl-CoA dehydrogenase [Longimicrobiales bacterium]
MSELRRVVVIGGGTMGNGIAHVFAQHGHAVTLVDVSEARLGDAVRTIAANLDRQVKKGALSPEAKDETLERLRTATSLDVAADSDLVIEAVPERLELKAEIFGRVDEVAPEGAILASNTSSISITTLGAFTRRADRVIGMHFMNPVPVMRLVEVIRGLATTDDVTMDVMTIARNLDKTPVEVNDFPGFVSNRVLMPMINEAIFCVMENVASPEAIDTVMKLGMNHPLGPLALADLIGLDTCLSILEVLHRDLGEDKYRPCPLLRNYVAAGWLGRKSGRGFYPYPAAHAGA